MANRQLSRVVLRLAANTRSQTSRGVDSADRIGQSGIVVKHVQAAEFIADAVEGGAGLVLVGEVGGEVQSADGVGVAIDADDDAALGLEPRRDGLTDRATRPGDDAHSIFQSAPTLDHAHISGLPQRAPPSFPRRSP